MLAESIRLTGNARVAVEIEVAAILARSKDRVSERGGSREWQETRSRAERAQPVDTGAAGAGLIGREIAHRIDLNLTAEAVVQLDLEHHYDLLARERRKIALTRDEAISICLAVGGANLQLNAVARCGRGLGISRT